MASRKGEVKDSLCLLAVSLAVILSFSDAAFTENIDRCPAHALRDKRILRTVGRRCYQFIREEKLWNQARNDCRGKGGDLITIQTPEIQHMVQDAMTTLWSKNGMWIGASDIYREMEWLWVTGERIRYNNWDGGQPSCRLFKFLCHEDCGVVRKDKGFRWHDYLCGSDLFNYGYACQYDLLPPPPTTKAPTTTPTTSTTISTTTSTTTTRATTMTTTTEGSTVTATTSKATPKLPNGTITVVSGSSELTLQPTTSAPIQITNSSMSVHIVPENIVNVESQRLSKKESGLQTGGVVGLVVSFLIVFLAGIIIGIVMCRRRNRHKYPEDVAMGFNNVLYTAAPRRLSLDNIKETNVLAAAAACNVDDDADDDDHGYSSIDEVQACAKNVNLPTAKEIEDYETREQPRENHYETVPSEPLEEEGGAMDDVPPPYPGCNISGFRPEFLKKDTDVSQAYSNNLYGYKG